MRASSIPAALPVEDAPVAEAVDDPVEEEPCVRVAVEAVPLVLADPEPLVVGEAPPELVVLPLEPASLFSTWNQTAETGTPSPAALAKPAMSKPILAVTSAGGSMEENWLGTVKPSG